MVQQGDACRERSGEEELKLKAEVLCRIPCTCNSTDTSTGGIEDGFSPDSQILLMMFVSLWAPVAVCVPLLALAMARTTNQHLLANKCCPFDQQLKTTLDTCMPLPSSNGPPIKQETVAEARTRLPEDAKFPSWIDYTSILSNTDSEENSTDSIFGLLQNASQYAVLQYGHRPCKYEDSHYLFFPHNYTLFLNGTLQLKAFKLNPGENLPQQENIHLTPSDWCSDRFESEKPRFVVVACPCEKVTCVPRCCYRSRMYHVQHQTQTSSGECIYWNSTFIPSFHNEKCFVAGRTFANSTGPVHVISPTESSDNPKTSNFTVLPDDVDCDISKSQSIIYMELENHMPLCNDGYIYNELNCKPSWEEKYRRPWLQIDGSAILENFGLGRHYTRHEYCIDRGLIGEGPYVEEVDTVLFCEKTITKQPILLGDIYYIFVILVVSVFLLLTLATHLLTPQLRKAEHSKALCCHCATLLVGSLTLISGHVGALLDYTMCRVTAFLVQFSFLASLFWLNAMCFDLTRTFRQMRQNISGGRRYKYRFLFYSIYAWGCPSIMTAITIGIEYLPYKTIRHDHPLRPNIGAPRCWFLDTKATLLYYYAPNGVVLLANLVMFGMTVQRIYVAKRGTSIIRKGNANATKDDRRGDSEMFSVITRLFLLMGVTWAMEIITWCVTDNGATREIFYEFIVMDAMNMIRAVAIFLFTCCKKRVVEQVRARASEIARSCGCKSHCLADSGHPDQRHPSHASHTSCASQASASTQSSGFQMSDSVPTSSTPEVANVQDTVMN